MTIQTSQKPKIAKCKACAAQFVRVKSFQTWCSIDCACKIAQQAVAKKRAKENAIDKKAARAKLDAMRTKPQLVKLAQTAFNAFIRARDVDKPCISCGRPPNPMTNTTDAGHYRSVGSAPHLRFVEDNCHGQCKHCNQFLAGNHVAYRAGLIERIGLPAVARIESDSTARKYSKEGLIEIARHYNAEMRKLKKDSQRSSQCRV